jgi:O-antigen/teichoic acid export membrane protein
VNSESTKNLSEANPNVNSERRGSNWDIRNAPKNYFWLVVAQAGSSLFAFASVWLITKTIGSEGYGGVVAIIAASHITQVLVSWTGYSLLKFGTEEFVESEKISRIFWVRLFVFLPNLLLVLLASRLWFPPLAEWLNLSNETFYLVILHFITVSLWIHVQYGLQGVKMQRLQGGLLTIERLIIFGGLVFLWYFGNLTPFNVILFYAISPLVMALVGTWFLRQYIFKPFKVDRKFLREILVYSLPLLPFSLVGCFSGNYVDAVFISKFLSTKDLGIYSVATQINGIFLQVPTLANSLLIPFFVTLQAENRTNLLNRYFQHTFPALTLIGGLATSIVAFLFYFLIPLIFGQEFSESVLPLWILLTASAISLPSMFGYAALVHSSGMTYIATISTILSAAVNITANFILIPKYGMAGCAWATVLTYLVTICVFAFFLIKNIKIPLSWTFLAILPTISSAIMYSIYQNPWLALLVGMISTIIILFVYFGSIRNSFEIVQKIRNR